MKVVNYRYIGPEIRKVCGKYGSTADPLISKKAASALNTSDIIDIHTPVLCRTAQKTIKSSKMIDVVCSVTGARRFIQRINGQLHPLMPRVMSLYGC